MHRIIMESFVKFIIYYHLPEFHDSIKIDTKCLSALLVLVFHPADK